MIIDKDVKCTNEAPYNRRFARIDRRHAKHSAFLQLFS
nr:MAG TPA: hypothetical protein [Bacteriophage sp.]